MKLYFDIIYVDIGFALRDSLFKIIKLTKNADPDKFSYSVYGISFYVPGNFSLPNGGFGRNIIIFGVDMNSSVHVN